jgi:uncharacterized coiled-coil DUF342 family protein
MSGDNKCLKDEDFKELEGKINDLEREFNKSTYMIDSMNMKIDELKEMVKGLVDELSKIHDYKYKVDNLCDTFVSMEDFYFLKSDVDKLKERFAENDRSVQRYQWWITIIMGIITSMSLIKSLI